jgi:hypothetical protein
MSDSREAGSGLEGLGSQTPLDVHPGKAKGHVQHGNAQVGASMCLLRQSSMPASQQPEHTAVKVLLLSTPAQLQHQRCYSR